jgi:hypothetical protein
MLLLTAFAALSIAASPAVTPAPSAPSCAAATQTGTYRITAFTRDSAIARIGIIVLENVEGCLEATMVTDDGHPAIIERVTIKDDVLTGTLRMSRGDAQVKLRFAGKTLEGTIGEGKLAWTLAGRRTSDPELRVGMK